MVANEVGVATVPTQEVLILVTHDPVVRGLVAHVASDLFWFTLRDTYHISEQKTSDHATVKQIQIKKIIGTCTPDIVLSKKELDN